MARRESPADKTTAAAELADLRKRVKGLERRIFAPPDPGYVLTEVGDDLHFLYVPSGVLGPKIGGKVEEA